MKMKSLLAAASALLVPAASTGGTSEVVWKRVK